MNNSKMATKKIYRQPRIVHEEKIEARAGGCGKSTATNTACTGSGFNS